MQRRHHRQHTNANATDESCPSQHGMFGSPSLQSGAYDEDNKSNNNRVSQRNPIGNRTLVHGPYENTQFSDRREELLPESTARCMLRYFWTLHNLPTASCVESDGNHHSKSNSSCNLVARIRFRKTNHSGARRQDVTARLHNGSLLN